MEKQIAPIPGHTGYFCTPYGDVYSVKSGELKIMKQRTGTRGYKIIALAVGRGRYKYALVHRLILATWSGQSGEGLEVNHKNGVKTDNRLENLEWVSRTQNERHSRAELGKDMRGEKHTGSKLTTEQVIEIRKLKGQGWSYPKLSKKYGIGMSQLHRIVKRIKWAHV